MEQVKEMKYLGAMISGDGTNYRQGSGTEDRNGIKDWDYWKLGVGKEQIDEGYQTESGKYTYHGDNRWILDIHT